ncbi:deoxyuridine 5'-triphosphate nucleotidohydrolase [Amylibacter marinus]|uniref:Deoxyuridine 5'-triphosphate nucleotidohydrolase n=1 Tax=Amylibacter marinus TaxID=1475483 RepID=A0ABQ5VV13_9RHOB|nr:dUTP diphosphatase [Amylibacter marinus]GLQ34994.1 deoxyuridine 5'-triphosphate nucleotidohydrolase [Amylibacter marinus]
MINVMYDAGADPAIALPTYESAGAAGMDVRANFGPDQRAEGVVLGVGQRLLIPSGLRLEIPTGFEIQVRPRSGLAYKHGVTILNAPGTIDSDYRGPLGILLINHGADPFPIGHGDRIAQLVVATVSQMPVNQVNTLSDTARGSGGFGSTGRE